jgi:LPXTG-site transpeptidase (sortase) family protein
MQSKRLSKWSLLILRIVETTISLMIILFLIFRLFQLYYPNIIFQDRENIKLTENNAISLVSPVRLKIPSLNIDTPLESVGLTSQGAVGVPKVYTNAAWYNLGPRPGEVGSSIIDGHSGWKNGIQSVFDNLYKIKKGDKLYVEDENGIIFTFVVREFRVYSLNDDISDIFSSSDGKAHLNLITCVTARNVNQKSPNDRFVVFSDKEE